MCNKLNRLNMEEKFISPQKAFAIQPASEREASRKDLKQISKHTHCAIRRSEFLHSI